MWWDKNITVAPVSQLNAANYNNDVLECNRVQENWWERLCARHRGGSTELNTKPIKMSLCMGLSYEQARFGTSGFQFFFLRVLCFPNRTRRKNWLHTLSGTFFFDEEETCIRVMGIVQERIRYRESP